MNDFDRVAAAIRFLDRHQAEQPPLGEIAAASGLSESHFHRLFQRWAGVTPKDFLQCLTASHARQRLQASASVLESALESGLSGPGRLHDLMVTLEAASPGEIRTGGRGIRIGWGRMETPFGNGSLGWTPRGICHLVFEEGEPWDSLPARLAREWPSAEFQRDDAEAACRAREIFHAPPPGDPPRGLRAYVRGTPFQVQVWRALLNIPEGRLASYRWVAAAVGNPGACRAVGAACGANPVSYLIPCHRVIRETGVVEGYRWGTDRKRAMLVREMPR
ncbi:MAG TPA: 6-O-methylguanine DNA methyltransferase [Verrucomicrobiales bacterium]|nr:6-O-methylguanine DNA methyltransferase [Verrucomicrobiales bacterium]